MANIPPPPAAQPQPRQPPVNIVGIVDLVDPAPLTTSWIYYAVGCDLMELLKLHIGRGGTLPYTEDVNKHQQTEQELKKELDSARVNLVNCSHVNDPMEWADLLNKVTDIAIEYGKISGHLKMMEDMHIGKGGSLPYVPNIT
ncbi:unnamed protein product [Adineta steineri]|uniref:Uncharacterized protein n=1 Tax=Adineta steineri TaxID=433720 RepID=A0A814NHD5_9BILA|nr:unnamed protein product [Adineta steineri]CAF1093659.1 unnamed protein product [Adineta steineri]